MRHPWLGSHTTPRTVATATLAAMVAVALAACGSSSGDSNSSGSGLTTIKVGLGGNIFDIPLRVADRMGYFKKHGLQVQFVSLAPTAGTPALQSGSLQFLNDSPTDFLIAESKGTNELSVGVDAVGAPLGLVSSTKFAAAHHLTASTPAATVAKALIGSTAGASAPTTKAETGIMLRSYGVSLSQQKWVTLPTPAADKAALKSGGIDWFTTSEPAPLSLQASGDGVVLVNPDKSPAWANSQIGIGELEVTTKAYARANPATVRKFVTAVDEATAYLRTHEKQILPVASEALPGIPEQVMLQSMQQVDWPATTAQSPSLWKTTLAWIKEQDLVSGLGSTVNGSDYTDRYRSSG